MFPSHDPPPVPREGQLWYDTESLELSIYYIDDDRGQWVPTTTAYNYDSDLETITYDIARETRQREEAIHRINDRLDNINTEDVASIQAIERTVSELQQIVSQIPEYDLNLYQTEVKANIRYDELTNRIDAIAIPDVTPFAIESDVNQELAQLQAQINQLPTNNDIPDVSSFVTTDELGEILDATSSDYLLRNGGLLTGSFVIEKEDVSLPAFDVSSSPAYSNQLFKLQSYNSQYKTTTFGDRS